MSVKKININQSEQTYDITSDVGYLYAGVATPTTDPGTPDGKVVYFASTHGTYPHFGNITVEENQVVTLYNINGSWESHEISNNNDFNIRINGIEQRCYLTENEEYLWALVDANSVVLGGVKREGGEWYIPVGASDDVVNLLKSLQKQIDDAVSYNNSIYHIIENDTYLLAIMDKDDNCLGGITRSGRWVIPDGISDEAQRHIDDIRKNLTKLSNNLNEVTER